MPVLVNEFEVVNPPPPPAGQDQQPAPDAAATPDPIKAEEELERNLRHLHARAARLHAT